MKVRDICEFINSIAPFDTQEEFDNSGLLVGSPSDEVTGILFALDVTEPVIREAMTRNASLIVTHHPLMFSPRQRVTDEDYEGRLITGLIRSGISLIAAHTNLDRATGGINEVLASRCGLENITGEGFFRCGQLSEPVLAEAYARRLESLLRCTVRVMGPQKGLIRRVGVSSGSGGDAWKEAAASGCDILITGEMKHHLALAAADSGLLVFECGHFATEESGIRALAETLQIHLNTIECNLRVFVSEIPAYAFSQQP